MAELPSLYDVAAFFPLVKYNMLSYAATYQQSA